MAIGRAIVKEPKAFLFDEPLSNLDAALRARTRVELAELHQRMKPTMIYVTHDQIEAMTLADRIVVLNNRRIEQIGTPMEVYRRPASRFVAGFVGIAGDELPGGDAVGTAADACGPLAERLRARDRRRRTAAPGRLRARHASGGRARRRPAAAAPTAGDGHGGASGWASGRWSTAARRRNRADRAGRRSSDVRAGRPVRLGFDPSAVHLFDESGGPITRID